MRTTTTNNGGGVALDTTVLDSLREELPRAKGLWTEVGLFRNRAGRTDELENPALGAIHEFGSVAQKIPERSFLRMPLLTRLTPKRLAELPWAEMVKKRGLKRVLTKLGLMAEEIIQEAFSTRGFGRWAPLSRFTIRKKGSTAILIETGQLRQAIDSRVVQDPA